MDKNEEEKLLKKLKPKKFDSILFIVISFSPLLNLIMDLNEGDTKRLTFKIILSIAGLCLLILWRNDYKLGEIIYRAYSKKKK